MLIKFREILSRLPSVFFLAWVCLFFADTANLDDFLLKNNVLHTDTPVSIFEYSASGLHTVLECTNSSKQITFKNNLKPSKASHYIIDEDSPVINPDYQLTISGSASRILNYKPILNNPSYNNFLYIQNCELLI